MKQDKDALYYHYILDYTQFLKSVKMFLQYSVLTESGKEKMSKSVAWNQ